jgi:hypothetical protein
MQTIVQMGLIREQTPYKPNYDVLTYTDASFWSEVSEFAVPFDETLYKTAKQRAAIIMNASNGGELKPEGWIAGGKECAFCPFVKACGVERTAVPPHNVRATPQFVAEIADYARQANVLETEIERRDKALKDLQDTIKTRLREKGVRRIAGVVNWYRVGGRTYYSVNDMKAKLAELGEDTDDYAKVAEASDRLVISASIAAENVRPTMLLPGKRRKGGTRKPKATVKRKDKQPMKRKAKTSRAAKKSAVKTKTVKKSTAKKRTVRKDIHDV